MTSSLAYNGVFQTQKTVAWLSHTVIKTSTTMRKYIIEESQLIPICRAPIYKVRMTTQKQMIARRKTRRVPNSFSIHHHKKVHLIQKNHK